MSKGVNKVILIGNIGQDPESRTFTDGSSVTNISVATSESWKDKQGQVQERTEWSKVVLRDRGAFKLGQIAAQYLKKGSKVYIEGKLQTRKWTDNQGVEKYITEIIAEQMQMLDGKQEGQSPQQTPAQGPKYTPQPSYSAPQSFEDFDDDLPNF